MDVCLWSKLTSGRVVRMQGWPADAADRMFDAHKKLITDPFVQYYRVTLEDPMRGGYVVRDTDREIHGIGGDQ